MVHMSITSILTVFFVSHRLLKKRSCTFSLFGGFVKCLPECAVVCMLRCVRRRTELVDSIWTALSGPEAEDRLRRPKGNLGDQSSGGRRCEVSSTCGAWARRALLPCSCWIVVLLVCYRTTWHYNYITSHYIRYITLQCDTISLLASWPTDQLDRAWTHPQQGWIVSVAKTCGAVVDLTVGVDDKKIACGIHDCMQQGDTHCL